MDRLTQAKLALLLIAAILFAGSLRLQGADWLRWVAIGLLVVALALRFLGRKPDAR